MADNLSDDRLILGEGTVGDRKVKVMRDNGATVCTLRHSLARGHEFTGVSRKVHLLNSAVVEAPEVRVRVDTPFYSGWITAVTLEEPLYDLVIGNITGARNGLTRDAVTQTPDAAITAADTEEGTNSLSPAEDDQVGAAVLTRAAARRKDTVRPLVVQSPGDLANSEEVRKEVESDPLLQGVRRKVLEGSVIKLNSWKASFVKERGLIYRQLIQKSGEQKRQLVVPAKYRQAVLQLAHNTALGGHLGRGKTLTRVLANFYWPGVGQEVARYVRSCDICQKTTDKGRLKPAPLQPLPLIDSPFERVAVDIVGPIEPRASDGSRYILTLVDFATRWPEAVPLRNIETTTVAEALVSIFCRVGIPKQVLSDRGTQFTSAMMEEVWRLLACRGLQTTPYHPMGNGLCERFNGTLKKMLKRMAAEQPKEWPRFISPLLFAYREAPQSSTKFSPFELVYGRTVKGPLCLLRELWDGDIPDPEVKTTYQYVLDLEDRLRETCQLAREELVKAREVQKAYYDKKTKLRKFSGGDECLVLLPTVSNKLLAQWKGPYEVLEKKNDLNYTLSVDGKPKRFHINLLKQYFQPGAAASCVDEHGDSGRAEALELVKAHFCEPSVAGDVSAAVVIRDEDEDDEGPVTVSSRQSETVSDVKLGEQLERGEREQLVALLERYSEVFSDKPGMARVPPHHVELTSNEPVRTRPYSVPLRLMDEVKSELRDMEASGIIERSTSPYCSPMVVVKKEKGVRVCGDYRRVNAITCFDAEPMSDSQAIFATLTHSRIFSRLDLTKGFFQVPLTEESKKSHCFQHPGGFISVYHLTIRYD